MSKIRIGLIGDYSPNVRAHVAIPQALELASGQAGSIEFEWLATAELTGDVSARLAAFHALWCVPASPYADTEGALAAIRFAREHDVPFLGTCGGFQHAIIEYARNVCGFKEADHTELNPGATMPVIAGLTCSLVGARGNVALHEGSRARRIYGATETIEEYHCNYGFNPRYRSMLENQPLRITGVDAAGDARILELNDHTFFVATLFQPELSALRRVAHPLLRAYVQRAAKVV